MKGYIAACIMCKDDTLALIENINYHKKIGFDYFLVYDNLSENPIRINDSRVKVIRWDDEKKGSQMRCFQHCLDKYKKQFQWISFFDVDEFIVLKKDNDIKHFLKRYEPFGGIGIQWKCFGSSGIQKKPKSIIESYIHATETADNKHIKTIVQTKYAVKPTSPHSFSYVSGKCCVNEKKKVVKWAYNKPYTYTYVQLNHYVTRSREDFELKRKRGGGNIRTSTKLTEGFWNRFQNGKREVSILNFLKRIGK